MNAAVLAAFCLAAAAGVLAGCGHQVIAALHLAVALALTSREGRR